MESYSVPSSPFDHYAIGDTDSSADSASYGRSSHSANSSPYTSSRHIEALPVLASSYATPLSSSTVSHHSSHSHVNVASTPTTSASSVSSTSLQPPSPPSLPRDRPVRTKDRLKHSESENRRRTRLRHKFSLLRDSSGCVKKDRYTILTTAVSKLNELQSRLQQVEQEKAALLVNISNLTQQPLHKELPPTSPLSPLTSLSSYPLLASIAAAFVSLDGRILDVNSTLCHALRSGKEDLVHSSLFALCDPVHLVDTVCVLKRLLDGDCPNWEMYRWLVQKDGSRLRMHGTIAPVHHEGRLVFFVLLLVPSVAEAARGAKEGYDVEAVNAMESNPYPLPASLPPPVEPKHELDTRLPYSNAYPSPPSTYGQGPSVDDGSSLLASPPPDASDLRFLHSVDALSSSSLNTSAALPLKVEGLDYFTSRPTNGAAPYPQVLSHERQSGGRSRDLGHPPTHQRPPSASFSARRSPPRGLSMGQFNQQAMGGPQTAGAVGVVGMDGRGGWMRPSMSAPNSPTGRKGGRGMNGGVVVDDWLFGVGGQQGGVGLGNGEGVDGDGGRTRMAMVDMRC